MTCTKIKPGVTKCLSGPEYSYEIKSGLLYRDGKLYAQILEATPNYMRDGIIIKAQIKRANKYLDGNIITVVFCDEKKGARSVRSSEEKRRR